MLSNGGATFGSPVHRDSEMRPKNSESIVKSIRITNKIPTS